MELNDDSVPPRFLLDGDGLCAGAAWCPSPHCDERPADARVELLVIHNISLPPGEFGGACITDLFLGCLDPAAHPDSTSIAGLRVSSHFLIRRDGTVIQYVPCGLRAWHAGVSSWKGREQCNDYSVGIELEGTDEVPFTDAQTACWLTSPRRSSNALAASISPDIRTSRRAARPTPAPASTGPATGARSRRRRDDCRQPAWLLVSRRCCSDISQIPAANA